MALPSSRMKFIAFFLVIFSLATPAFPDWVAQQTIRETM
jgi:hypothetical protein